MKERNLKILLTAAGAFSSVLAVREGRKMKKMMEDTKDERSRRVEEQFNVWKEEWNNKKEDK